MYMACIYVHHLFHTLMLQLMCVKQEELSAIAEKTLSVQKQTSVGAIASEATTSFQDSETQSGEGEGKEEQTTTLIHSESVASESPLPTLNELCAALASALTTVSHYPLHCVYNYTHIILFVCAS